MSNDIGFEFPLDNSDEWNGFNDPGMEHFSGNPYVHVGKEVPQNTLDAIRSRDEPARLDFSVIDVPTDSIPGVDELLTALESCRAEATAESEKAVAFFNEAVSVLTQPKLSVLIISDSNTTGVEGPCERGAPYHAFMKAIGQSKKPSATGLGSFGIGKFAPFTLSKLRTVFVSTIWADKGHQVHYVQGKSILMSHRDATGATRKSVGYWGLREKCQPITVRALDNIPSWLKRDELGTTLAVLGFDAVRDWDKLLAASVAQNFFGAIAANLLVANVGGIELSQSTLASFFDRDDVLSAVEEQQTTQDQFREAGQFLEALGEDERVVVRETENPYLGNCEVRILVAEGLPKRVAILRDGMFITAELSQLKRFSDFKDFVAVFRCLSEKGNKLLRAMEPPRHDDFEPQRLHDPETQRRGKAALRDIGSWVRETLKQHARDPISEETTLDELAEYFSDYDETPNARSASDGEINPRGSIVIQAKPIRKWAPSPPGESGVRGAGSQDGDSGPGDEVPGGSSDGADHSDNEGWGWGLIGGASARNIELLNVRAIPVSPSQRRIFFTANHTGQVVLTLQSSGADTNQPLGIISATQGQVVAGAVQGLHVMSGHRMEVMVTLSEPFTGAIRISAHAV